MPQATPRFMIIDGNALVHRAYHALPPLTAPDGVVVNAVYGFAMVLIKALKDIKPAYAVVAFDRPEPTFRHERYKEYKATREKKSQDLYDQIPLIQEMVRAFGIPTVDLAGFEADDIIATLSTAASSRNRTVENSDPHSPVADPVKTIILTGDMDTLQLVDSNTEVWGFRKGMSDIHVLDILGVKEKMGLTPIQTIDYKALRGDTSDNIKGVPGIGEKTATELISAFGSIEKLYEALENDEAESVRPRIRDILLSEKAAAFESKYLVTLIRDVPIETNLTAYTFQKPDREKLRELFEHYGFRTLLKRVEDLGNGEQTSLLSFSAKAKEEAPPSLPTFFAETSNAGTTGHDVKAFIKQSGQAVETFSAPFFDTMVASYILHSNSRQHDLDTLAKEYNLSGKSPADTIAELIPKMHEGLKKEELEYVCDSIEMPLIPVLSRMELLGIAVDTKYLQELTDEFGKELERLEKKIWELAGMEFNVSSPTQMREVLFEKMQLAPETGRIKKTSRGGVASTAAGELEKLRGSHPIIDEIFSHRELAKLKSTYTDSLIALVDSESRVHTTFVQIGAATGRMSSTNPNLQNIPIRSENGQRVRKAFVAAKGYTLVSADYSQIELRVAASLSNDSAMIEAFLSGEDFHAKTAALMFDTTTDKVTPNMRRDAKAINFGILYGMGAQALSVGTGMSHKEADEFIKRYFSIFKTLGEYLQTLKEQAKALGYVTTLFGRRRYIPEINSPMQQVRASAERMAINMPIQGTATGDLMKLAMNKIDAELLEGNRDDIRMLLQVHDELVFEIKTSEVKKYAPKIKKIMEDVHAFKVPIVADLKSGPNWGEMKKLI